MFIFKDPETPCFCLSYSSNRETEATEGNETKETNFLNGRTILFYIMTGNFEAL